MRIVSQRAVFIRHLHKRKPVTVCIAAICDAYGDTYNPKIVFCADRLVSAGVQYEGGESKIKKLTEYCYAMQSSNDSRLSDMILENAKLKLNNLERHHTMRELVEIIRQECIDFKEAQIKLDVLSKYNFVIEHAGTSPETLARDAMEEVNQYEYRLECEFLILGFDDAKTAHIYKVDQDGNFQLCDSLGFAAIGSGGWLAFVEMTKYRYSTQDAMTTAIPRVYFAKKISERAEGVGRDTDFFIAFPVFSEKKEEPEKYHLVTITNTGLAAKLDDTLNDIHTYEAGKLDEISQYISAMIEKDQNEDETGPGSKT